MKKILAIGFILASITFASCKKTETKPEPIPEPTPTAPTTPTVGVMFFLDADSFQIKELYNNQPWSDKAAKAFTSLGAQNICTAPGTTLSVQNRNTNINDTSFCSFKFYKNSVLKTCETFVTKNGKVGLVSSSPTAYIDSSCVIRAVVFN